MRTKSLIASLVTLVLGLAPAIAYAAGLGRLNILSSIGQPLNAEIELVSVRPDELSTLAARIAPPEAYRDANITFNPALVGARASIERRPGGAPYIRVTSSRPLEEPFIDLLVEVSWNTGRLVREYTALVDPPGFGPKPAPAPPVGVVSPPEGKPVPAPKAPAAARPAEGGERTYGPVRPGETLRQIAAGVRPEGVSLDQALVGIYRSNPDAFINNNMNLLRSGRVLRIPDAAEMGKLAEVDAGKEVRVQAADWNAYRQRVAGAAPEAPATEPRAAAGKITTRVEEAAPAAPPGKEVVKVSKGAPGKDAGTTDKALQDRIRVLEEEATAREKTLREANERIASLEKTLKDMQRLLELKGAAVPPPAVPTPPPAVTPPAEKPEAKAPPVEPAKPEAVPPAVPPAAETKPEAVPPAPPPVAETKPEAKKPDAAPPPPPAAAEAWYEDPLLLGGALLGLGVLGGLIYMMRRRPAATELPHEPTLRAPTVPAPVAPSTAAATAAAVPVASATTEMPAQPAPTPAAVDDVDPIQEADVYIAYGRDAQAEEILKEALAKNPHRQEIKLKLLEIYAARKSKNDFNALAADLHDATQGRGDLWLKAATMGFALDPDNALYAAGKDSAILPPVGVATDVNLDFDLDMVAAAGAPTTVTDVPLDAGHEQTVKTMALSPERMEALRAEGAARAATDTQPIMPDIDLGAAPSAPNTDITLQPAMASGPITDVNLDVPRTGTDSNVIDFEFDPSKTIRIEPEAAAAFAGDRTVAISPDNQDKARDLGVEIDLGALDAPAPTIPGDSAQRPVSPESTSEITFDFQLPSEPQPTAEVEVPPTDVKLDVPENRRSGGTQDFALDTVALDLGDTGRQPDASAAPRDDHWYDVQTKFDLAKAYQEMGDKEGAREILSEVLKEGDAQQQAEANALLAKL